MGSQDLLCDVPHPGGHGSGVRGGLLAPLLAYFLNARGWWGYFSAGLANGFLLCGLVYSFLALTSAQDTALHGMTLMICFGIGTVPAMLLIGCGTTFLKQNVRLRMYRAGAALVVDFGFVTIWRGLPSGSADGCHSASRAEIRLPSS
jgi:sulfite exporter TauE/SafE